MRQSHFFGISNILVRKSYNLFNPGWMMGEFRALNVNQFQFQYQKSQNQNCSSQVLQMSGPFHNNVNHNNNQFQFLTPSPNHYFPDPNANPSFFMGGKHTVHWFRRGLRLHDNPSLREGIRYSATFRCIFILDPWFAGSSNVGINKWRWDWLSGNSSKNPLLILYKIGEFIWNTWSIRFSINSLFVVGVGRSRTLQPVLGANTIEELVHLGLQWIWNDN